MAKIKGWKKLINTKTRQYWENKEIGMIANVEKLGHYWTFTWGDLHKEQITDTVSTKKEAMNRAIGYMKKHPNG